MSVKDAKVQVEDLQNQIKQLKQEIKAKDEIILKLQQRITNNNVDIDDIVLMKSKQLEFDCTYNSFTTTVKPNSFFPFWNDNCDDVDDSKNSNYNESKQNNIKNVELLCFGYLRQNNVLFPNDIASNILKKYLTQHSINVKLDLLATHAFQTVIFNPSINNVFLTNDSNINCITNNNNTQNTNINTTNNNANTNSSNNRQFEINMRFTIVSNECNNNNYSGDAYNIAVGVIGVPKIDGHHSNTNFLKEFQIGHAPFCTLHSISKVKSKWKNITSDYLFSGYYNGQYDCYFGLNGTILNHKLYDQGDYNKYKANYNKLYCFKTGDFCDVVIEKILIHDDDDDDDDDGQRNEQYYCLIFKKNGRKIIGEDIKDGIYKNGQIRLNTKEYDYYFAMSSNTCNCDNVKGFEFKFDFFTPI